MVILALSNTVWVTSNRRQITTRKILVLQKDWET